MRFVVRRGFRYGELLLGFDARIPLGGELTEWNEPQRNCHLIRPEVRHVQSVDTTLWPSLFDYDVKRRVPGGKQAWRNHSGLEAPEWTGTNHGLWTELRELREQLTTAPAHWVIGVSVIAAESGAVGPYLEPSSPEDPEAGWVFLGWDVADGSRLSALTNCGQGAAIPEPQRRQWAGALNDQHLFRSGETADAFRRHCDHTIKGCHAPFYVYGLWHVTD